MTKTIMFVDDNIDERILIKRRASKSAIGLRMIESSGGANAIEQLNAMDKNALPSMILLDLKMPQVDGLQVLQWIRSNEKTKHVPVVMFSTSDDKQDIANSYELGANSYVVKDINHQNCLDILCVYWAEINKPFAKKSS